MKKEKLTREELIEINLNDILYYLQDENKFSTLFRIPTDKEVNRLIRIRYKVEEETVEFLDHLKRIQKLYDRMNEIADLIIPLGETREEVLRGLGKVIAGNQKITRAYEDFLERYSHPKVRSELRGKETWRFRSRTSQTLDGIVSAGPIDLSESGILPDVIYRMEELDIKYCVVYPERKAA